MAWNDWGFVDAKQLFDPANTVWDHKSNAPTQLENRGQMDALVGGGLGDPNAAYWSQDITHNQAPQMRAAQAGAAPQMQGAQLQLGADPFRQGQIQQIGQLQRVASGQQQGAGELAAQRQIQQALAAQQAQARMARGGNAALAYRNAANQSAALGATGAGMGQRAALQDQAQAQSTLSGALGQGRGMDIGVAGQNAGYAQQAGMQNAQLGQQTNLANAGFQQQAGMQNAGMQQQNQQLNTQNYLSLMEQLNKYNIAKYNADLGIGAQQDAAASAKQGGLISGIGGAIAAFSDERLKTDITDGDAEIDQLLDGLKPKGFSYKDPKHGAGHRVGIMAQDMERSELGKRIVMELPEGKALDVNKALSAALAATARLNARLRAVEGR